MCSSDLVEGHALTHVAESDETYFVHAAPSNESVPRNASRIIAELTIYQLLFHFNLKMAAPRGSDPEGGARWILLTRARLPLALPTELP